jgi:hypothetical protein
VAEESWQLADEVQDLADKATGRAIRARHQARWAEQHPVERVDRVLGRLDGMMQPADRPRGRVQNVIRVAGQEWAKANEREGD